jgi:uncharacterized LabA/DUF88 family protein
MILIVRKEKIMSSPKKTKSTTIVKPTNQDKEFEESIGLFFDIIGKSTEETVRALNHVDLLDNVAIFVDYDNVYWTLKKIFNHDPDHEDLEKNLFHQLWKRYGQDHVRTFRVYADFQKIRTSLTNLQKNRVQIRHVYSNGKEGENRKNSSDIELCIDAIENTYKDPGITCYVFVTADSDMIPIMSRMMYKGKRVELFYLSDAAPKYVEMSNYVHHSEDLSDFLNIERKIYNVNDYIIPGLQIIVDWESKYEAEGIKFLGAPYLKGQFSKLLEIPELTASDLIELLQIQNYIEDSNKKLKNGQVKNSIKVSEKGHALLQLNTSTQIAATEAE